MTETRLALLTPAGTGAIATIAVVGSAAWSATKSLFHPRSGTLPDEAPANAIWVGQFGSDVRDEIVLAVADPKLPRVEIHCHGGPQVVRMIADLYEPFGVKVCTWQELEHFCGEAPWRISIKDKLTRAPTARTAAILLDQYQAAHQSDSRRFADLGAHLVTPWRVAIIGAPNVGKSSLINALAGYERALVSPIPGTTRDVVTTLVAIDGWPVELCDTAGLRAEGEALEQAGMARARLTAENADLCLWVIDGAGERKLPDGSYPHLHLIVNKCDLAPAWDRDSLSAARVSARTGEGIAELCALISRALVPEVPEPGEAVPWQDQQHDICL